jgi:predicted nuclease of predicted toxin-antitoxin system
MSRATDEEILALSLEQGAAVVTLDADFHAILAVSGASGPSVIRLRLQGLGAPEVVDRVQNVLARFEADLERGSLVTVKPHKTTCHRLPVGSSS